MSETISDRCDMIQKHLDKLVQTTSLSNRRATRIKNMVGHFADHEARYERTIESLKSWIRAEGEAHNTCTFGVLREVCKGCNCDRRNSA